MWVTQRRCDAFLDAPVNRFQRERPRPMGSVNASVRRYRPTAMHETTPRRRARHVRAHPWSDRVLASAQKPGRGAACSAGQVYRGDLGGASCLFPHPVSDLLPIARYLLCTCIVIICHQSRVEISSLDFLASRDCALHHQPPDTHVGPHRPSLVTTGYARVTAPRHSPPTRCRRSLSARTRCTAPRWPWEGPTR